MRTATARVMPTNRHGNESTLATGYKTSSRGVTTIAAGLCEFYRHRDDICSDTMNSKFTGYERFTVRSGIALHASQIVTLL
jgi:hypothetical protein